MPWLFKQILLIFSLVVLLCMLGLANRPQNKAFNLIAYSDGKNIYLSTPDGTWGKTWLSHERIHYVLPKWSPDGKWLAYIEFERLGEFSSGDRILNLWHLGHGKPQPIYSAYHSTNYSSQWAAHGNWLFFSLEDRHSYRLRPDLSSGLVSNSYTKRFEAFPKSNWFFKIQDSYSDPHAFFIDSVNLADSRSNRSADMPAPAPQALLLSADEKTLYAATENKLLYLLHQEDKAEFELLYTLESPIYHLISNPHKNSILILGEDWYVEMPDLVKGIVPDNLELVPLDFGIEISMYDNPQLLSDGTALILIALPLPYANFLYRFDLEDHSLSKLEARQLATLYAFTLSPDLHRPWQIRVHALAGIGGLIIWGIWDRIKHDA